MSVCAKILHNGYCYENRALIPATFQPKLNLVETTKACIPVVTPYFDSSCCVLVLSFLRSKILSLANLSEVRIVAFA